MFFIVFIECGSFDLIIDIFIDKVTGEIQLALHLYFAGILGVSSPGLTACHFIPIIFCLTVPIFCVFLFSSLVRQFVTGAGENLPGTYYPLSTITPNWTPPTVTSPLFGCSVSNGEKSRLKSGPVKRGKDIYHVSLCIRIHGRRFTWSGCASAHSAKTETTSELLNALNAQRDCLKSMLVALNVHTCL